MIQQNELKEYFLTIRDVFIDVVDAIKKCDTFDPFEQKIVSEYITTLQSIYTTLFYFYNHKKSFSPTAYSNGLLEYNEYLNIFHAMKQKEIIRSEIKEIEVCKKEIIDTILESHTLPSQEIMRETSKNFLLDSLKVLESNDMGINSCTIYEDSTNNSCRIVFTTLSLTDHIPKVCVINATCLTKLDDEMKRSVVTTINGQRELNNLQLLLYALDEKLSFLVPHKVTSICIEKFYNTYCNDNDEILQNSNSLALCMYSLSTKKQQEVKEGMKHSKAYIQMYEESLLGNIMGESRRQNIICAKNNVIQRLHDKDKSQTIKKITLQ